MLSLAYIRKDLFSAKPNYCITGLHYVNFLPKLIKGSWLQHKTFSCLRENGFKCWRSWPQPPGYITEIAQLTGFTGFAVVTSLDSATSREHTVLIFQYALVDMFKLICCASQQFLRFSSYTAELKEARRPIHRLADCWNGYIGNSVGVWRIHNNELPSMRLQTVKNVSMTTGM